ncbi:uncharacterized protein [Aegilops tauschii subsp. strangulata]|uniref:uncharacterized protein n=1 Tax=Aegilops tauschii subsp. strangulata TaxID=200361 RepID=UPI001ABD10FC|nr:uncharacterized protein LOC120968540 [Aegilops tauschii subsp. strangulata]
MIADKSECSGEGLPGATAEATASRARGQGLTLDDETACGTPAGSASDAERIEAPAKLEANPHITIVIAETGSESTESLKGVDNADVFIKIDTDSHGMGLAAMVETENGASLSTKSQPGTEQPPPPVPIVSHHRGTCQELMKVTSRVDAERKLKETELSNIQKHTSDRDIGRGRQDTGTSNRTHFSHSYSGECSTSGSFRDIVDEEREEIEPHELQIQTSEIREKPGNLMRKEWEEQKLRRIKYMLQASFEGRASRRKWKMWRSLGVTTAV